MYKFLDLFLALSNQSCLTYTSAAKSLCSDAEWSEKPGQKWVVFGEKNKKSGFLSHSNTLITSASLLPDRILEQVKKTQREVL